MGWIVTGAPLAARAAEWGPALLDVTLKGTLLLLVAAALTYALRSATSAARHLVWSVTLGAILALPLLPRLLPEWRVRVPATLPVPTIALRAARPPAPVRVSDAAAASRGTSVSRLGGEPSRVREQVVAAMPRHAGNTPSSSDVRDDASVGGATHGGDGARHPVAWLLGIWIAGVAAVLLRLTLGTLRVRGIARRAAPVLDPAWIALAQRLATRIGIRRPITLLRTEAACIPMTWGIVYPVVLLPAEADEWPLERRTIVLLHELAHVKRLDALTQWAAQIATALYWFNPLLWLAARQMRIERERACDNYVLTAGTRASDYARDLLDIVRALGAGSTPAFATLAMARRSEFEGRLLAILDPKIRRGAVGRVGAIAAALFAVGLVLPLAALRPAEADAMPAVAATESTPARERTLVVTSRGGPPPMNEGKALIADSSHRTAGARTDSSLSGGPPPTAESITDSAGTGQPATAGSSDLTPPAVTPSARTSARGSSPPCSWSGRWSARNENETRIAIGDDDRCVRVALGGAIEFTDDDRDIRSLSPGGYVTLEEERGTRTRRLDIRPGAGGDLVRTFSVNDETRPFDAEAREWMADLLPVVIRSSSSAAPRRVARFYARGGIRAVLAEIGEIPSDAVKRAYFVALLDGRRFPADTMRLITDAIGREIATDSEKARLLRQIAESGETTEAVRPNLVRAAETIASDGEKRRVLAALVRADGRETLIMAAKAASSIASDGEKGQLLLEIAERYMRDDELRAAYLEAAATIASDGEKSRVLRALLARDTLSAGSLVDLIGVAQNIASDGDKSGVLIKVATDYSLEPPAVRRAFFSAAATLASDGDKGRVLTAALARKDLSKDGLLQVLRTATDLASDGEKGRVLQLVAERYPLTDEVVRKAFFKTVETLSSDGAYRAVMNAVTKSAASGEVQRIKM
ncbi:MAG: M56 family metallopeptidase [Gemmatimonadaceae bacterium]